MSAVDLCGSEVDVSVTPQWKCTPPKILNRRLARVQKVTDSLMTKMSKKKDQANLGGTSVLSKTWGIGIAAESQVLNKELPSSRGVHLLRRCT